MRQGIEKTLTESTSGIKKVGDYYRNSKNINNIYFSDPRKLRNNFKCN